MALQYISVPSGVASSVQRVNLDGVEFVLRLEWVMRGGWTYSLADAAGTPVVAQRKVTPNTDLLRDVTASNRPLGQLWCVDRSGRGAKPGFADLGTSHPLIYVEEGTL